MSLIGFDTSTAATSVCVVRADGRVFEHVPPVDALARPPAHGRELLPALARLLAKAGIGFADVRAVAVGRGPGTFTGLRIGVATARAVAIARAIPIHPVSSLAALAAPIDAPVSVPVIDAKRGEVFAALYREGRELVPAFAATPEEAAARLGGDAVGALAVGDGSLRFREVLEAAGLSVAPGDSQLHVVRALHVCRLAAGVPAVHPEAALPTYLRAPDAITSS